MVVDEHEPRTSVHRVAANGELFDESEWRMLGLRLRLSERQREIARFICGSLSNDEIADQLGITSNTVRMHVRGLFKKIGVHDRVGVAVRLFQSWRNHRSG